MKRRALWSLALVTLVARATLADDVRPVQVQVREQEPGTFLVQWQVPQLLPPQAMPSPVLPDSCVPEGERTIQDRPGAWLNRRIYRCPDGISGQRLGIAYPFGNPALSTVFRVELLSGEQHATLLSSSEDSWELPPALALDAPLRAVQSALLDGVRHVFRNGVHVAFVVAIAILGSARLVTRFGLGQLVSVALAAFGLEIDLALGELGMALATALLASEAFRPEEERRSLGTLATATGVVHGLGWAQAGAGTSSLLVAVLGMDVTFLVLFVGTAKLFAKSSRIRLPLAYAVGAASVALGLHFLSADSSVEAESRPMAAQLPSLADGASTGAPGSRRVSQQNPDAAVQSFVSVEPFEVRHEILVRLRDVAGAVGLAGAVAVDVHAQAEVKRRVHELVASSYELAINGVPDEGAAERVDFMTVDPQGALPRPEPVRELVSDAFVGVTISHFTPSTANDLSLSWVEFEIAPEVPATVTDPEASTAMVLTPERPALEWKNELIEDPVPTVTAIAVEPRRVPLPLLSLPLLAAALFFVSRKRSGLARAAIASAILVGPLGDVGVAVPYSSAPTAAEARRVLSGILPNVYRAFEFREESAAYDRLAVSVTGETLTEIYLEHRRALEMEERGGARARVEAIEVTGVSSVAPDAAGGFDARASWSVGGTVTHFGHRHFRQNRYEAQVVVVPVEGSWKIRSIDVLDERRVR
jgi:hypothetical protein